MLSVLNDGQYQALSAVAAECGLQVLTEVSNPEELERALALDAAIIGINNRDLRTLQVDLENTLRLAPRIGRGPVVISESGISQRRHVLQLSPHVRGFLIGSALMKAPDLESACAHLVYGRNRLLSLKGQLA
jgi:indole-3-glycerol phosphate synthase/phosphoribosylanthranilate isomerase